VELRSRRIVRMMLRGRFEEGEEREGEVEGRRDGEIWIVLLVSRLEDPSRLVLM
jgi:hypothetical protein